MFGIIVDLIGEAGVLDVETEPKRLSWEGSDIPGGRSLNRSPEARLDVRRGFGVSGRVSKTLFDTSSINAQGQGQSWKNNVIDTIVGAS